MELYIHVPFCRQKCEYCDFVSYAGMQGEMKSYVETLLLEAEQQLKLVTEPIETVYIGGGTPSLLPASLLDELIRGIYRIFPIRGDAEFTSECNPGTLTREWLETARSLGINRLSIGMQAFQPSLLRLLGRIHRFEEVNEAVLAARKAGFRNVSLDLIFGIPDQTEADWAETLRHALSLSVEHISAYGLIPEEGTPLTAKLCSGQLSLPDSDTERSMYEMLKSAMTESGYEQYEISNFARPGFSCRHNIGYWSQVLYLGLGISAASMLNKRKAGCGICYTRFRNPVTFEEYRRLVLGQESGLREQEEISPQEARFETMMLGLRMNRGIDASTFLHLHGKTIEDCYEKKLSSFLEKGLMMKKDGRWFLTPRGMDIQNAILVELMEDN